MVKNKILTNVLLKQCKDEELCAALSLDKFNLNFGYKIDICKNFFILSIAPAKSNYSDDSNK